jgi:glycosyltransferase involved in cell wall biosynthesis
MIPKILWIFSDFPFPPTHGGRVDMWRRLNWFLTTLHVEIEMVITVSKGYTALDKEYQNRALTPHLVLRRQTPLSWFKRVPYQVASRAELKNIPLRETRYDYVILESEYVSPILENPNVQYGRCILRVHNDESKYYNQLSQSTTHLLKRALLALESKKFSRYSSEIFNKVDELWFLSFSEWQRIGLSNRWAKKSHYVPMPFVGKADTLFPKTTKKVLFVGSFFMENNRFGIEWFLKNVHPYLLEISGYQLTLVGSTQGKRSSWLSHLKTSNGVTVHCDVPDLKSFYREAAVFVNPMFHGAGVKIKSINAIEHGVPVVSTSTGVEGLPLVQSQHYLMANDAQEMILAIQKILSDPDYGLSLAKAAYAALEGVWRESEKSLKSLFHITSLKVEGRGD